jgi:hypothetical protein
MFQVEQCLPVTRAFDARTRAAAKRLGFDYAAEANESGLDITVFVQPDGSPDWYWTPGVEAAKDREIIVAQIHRAHTR